MLSEAPSFISRNHHLLAKVRIIRGHCATNQYFFLVKTTPMHATNSYSLELDGINNYIYTTSFLRPNRYAHIRNPSNQSRPSFVSQVLLCACVREGCVDAPLPRIQHETKTRCSFIIIKSGFVVMADAVPVIY